MKKVMTVMFVEDKHRILLGLKKRSLGAGLWNGFGGKVEPNETIEQAAVREMQEESGVTPLAVRKRGFISYYIEGVPFSLEVHFFSATKYEGTPVETDEMKPQWWDKKNIPYEQMWADDSIFLPWILEGKDVGGECWMDENKQVIRHTIKPL